MSVGKVRILHGEGGQRDPSYVMHRSASHPGGLGGCQISEQGVGVLSLLSASRKERLLHGR
jgi:hypothetical protein